MKWLLSLTIGAVLGAGVGCGADPSGTGGGGAGGSGGASPCDDPENGAVSESCGVWVSASLGEDANPGTQSAPVASLAHAVALAAGQTGHVYACAETWSEPLVLPGNMGLHGGFECENGWKYLGPDRRSILATTPDEIPLVVSDDGSGGKATVTDFHVEAADAVKPGGSSIGIFVRDTVPLWLHRCEVVAGNAADGLDAVPEEDPASNGADGNAGEAACSAAVSQGGIAPEASCEVGTSKGGAGGDGSTMIAANGETGEPASGDPNDGAGGLGEGNSPVCTDGKQGASGSDGAFGHGAVGFDAAHTGLLTADGYSADPGLDGQPGTPGQGGGGGGATFGSAAVCGAAPSGGAAGGSGGTGGCGGKGGRGGQPAGASFGIALRNKLGLFKTTVRAGNGGVGGDGAPGQAGGPGGTGGLGGPGTGSIQAGCAGGPGGKGGKGGWGGGGLGGSSIAIAASGNMGQWPIESDGISELFTGDPGLGGQGEPTVSPESFGWSGHKALVDWLPPQ